ncbi:MAG TPA: right-handed parallel beta-helix repeat-containing protein [Actinomycetota bacterium]
MLRKITVLAVALAAISPVAFAGEDGEGFTTTSCAFPADAPMPGSSDTVLTVGGGQQYATIQAAVDDAAPGDTVLIHPGEYTESVLVTTPYLRIRGTDRAGVQLNGETVRDIGIAVDGADGVVIENMTAHHYVKHGFFWDETHGYWGRYLTGYSNGLYGIYAFDARCGQLTDSYASGNADSGFYIGECFPCDAVIDNIVAEENALGYSGTNAGGNLELRNSVWRDNGLGIVPNSLDGEDRPPQRGTMIRNNLVLDNNNIDAPGISLAGTYWGGGIIIAGGAGNQVFGNTVTDHALGGIVLSPLPDSNVWIATGNTIWGNVVTHDAEAYPDAIDLTQGLTSGPGNCWADNDFSTSAPPMIEEIYDCGLPITPPGGDPRMELSLIEGAAGLNGRVQSPWETWPAPTAPEASIDMPASLTGPITEWLPAVM